MDEGGMTRMRMRGEEEKMELLDPVRDARLWGECAQWEHEAREEVSPTMTDETRREMRDLGEVRFQMAEQRKRHETREKERMKEAVPKLKAKGETAPFLRKNGGALAVPVAHEKYSLSKRGGGPNVKDRRRAEARARVARALGAVDENAPPRTPPLRDAVDSTPMRVRYLYELGRVDEQRRRGVVVDDAPASTVELRDAPTTVPAVEVSILGWCGEATGAADGSERLTVSAATSHSDRLRKLCELELRPYIDGACVVNGACVEPTRVPAARLESDETALVLATLVDGRSLRSRVELDDIVDRQGDDDRAFEDRMLAPWQWHTLYEHAAGKQKKSKVAAVKLRLTQSPLPALPPPPPLQQKKTTTTTTTKKSPAEGKKPQFQRPWTVVVRGLVGDGRGVVTRLSLVQGAGTTRRAADVVRDLPSGIPVLCSGSDETAVLELKVLDALSKRQIGETKRIRSVTTAKHRLRLADKRTVAVDVGGVDRALVGWLAVVRDVPPPDRPEARVQAPPSRLWAVLVQARLYLYRSRAALSPVHVLALADLRKVDVRRPGRQADGTAWLVPPSESRRLYYPHPRADPVYFLLDRAPDLRKEGDAWHLWQAAFAALLKDDDQASVSAASGPHTPPAA